MVVVVVVVVCVLIVNGSILLGPGVFEKVQNAFILFLFVRSFVRLVQCRVVSGEVLATTEIRGGGGRGN